MFKKYSRLALRIILTGILLKANSCWPGTNMAHAQSGPPSPINVTGHMTGVSGTPVIGTYIEFQLTNCAGNLPRILGYTGIAPSTGDFLPDVNGLVTGTIWPNDLIDCGGTTGNTRWQVTYVVNNVPQGPQTCYQLLSTSNPFNLDTATPATPCITQTPILPNDVTFHNVTVTGVLSAVNGVFTNSITAAMYIVNTLPTACPSGQYMTNLSTHFQPICGTLTFPVNSVFGRTGTVVATTGDYSCAQITGAICSLSGAYYQTVQVGGSPFTQRPILNFISGTGIVVGCADNSGNTSTDCTVQVATSSSAQKNCMTTVCAGGSTYSGGVTYTNLGSTTVFEEVGASINGGSDCGPYSGTLTYTVNGLSLTSGLDNLCGNTSTTVTFAVPPGATFSSAVTSGTLTAWLEVNL